MQENYVSLFNFNFGKRCYVVMKNGGTIKYFELVDGRYIVPVISFKLFDNEGKSLTYVNQHFFMSELVGIVNDAIKKGLLVSQEEIVGYLSDISAKISTDMNFKNIIKGTLMSEIDEANFEENKQRIIDYINSFKINTYIDYNNVSVFDGNLSKNKSEILEKNPIVEEQLNSAALEENLTIFDFKTKKFDNADAVNTAEPIASHDDFDFEVIEEVDCDDFNNHNYDLIDDLKHNMSKIPKVNNTSSYDLPTQDNNDMNSDTNAIGLKETSTDENLPIMTDDSFTDNSPSESLKNDSEDIQTVEDYSDEIAAIASSFGFTTDESSNDTENFSDNTTDTTNNEVADTLVSNQDSEIKNREQEMLATRPGDKNFINPFENVESNNNIFGTSSMDIHNENNFSDNQTINNATENVSTSSYIAMVQDRIKNNSPQFSSISNNATSSFDNEIGTDQTNFGIFGTTKNFNDEPMKDKETLQELEDLTVNMQPVAMPKADSDGKKGFSKKILIIMIIIFVIVSSLIAVKCFL